jgi:hypothetical protein
VPIIAKELHIKHFKRKSSNYFIHYGYSFVDAIRKHGQCVFVDAIRKHGHSILHYRQGQIDSNEGEPDQSHSTILNVNEELMIELLFLLGFSLHNLEEALWLPQWSKHARKYRKEVSEN